MKKVAFIPTRETTQPEPIYSFLKSAGWEVVVLSKYSSIFEAFRTGMESFKINAEDYVIFCHDDIEILTNPKDFNYFIDEKLEKPDTGFVGVAGTKLLKNSCVWWEDLNKKTEYLNPLSGFVLHGKKTEKMFGNWYGPYGRVAVLDGLFLCAKGSTLYSINLKKPEVFNGMWDFYDIYYTAQTTVKGKKNYTVPIQLVHESIGELAGRDSWHENRKAFAVAFSDHLPLAVS
jgi:hypothetical protein